MGQELREGAAARSSQEREKRMPRLPDLAELVRRMAQGHQDALAELYDGTSAMVNGLLLRILAHPQDAASNTEKRGSVQSWLLIMARNAAIDRIRQRNAQPNTLALEQDGLAEPAANEATPEQSSVLRERRRRVLAVMRELPPDQRQAVELAFFAGLTHAELAARLGE